MSYKKLPACDSGDSCGFWGAPFVAQELPDQEVWLDSLADQEMWLDFASVKVLCLYFRADAEADVSSWKRLSARSASQPVPL